MDFATILSPDLTFDWALSDGDLASDDGLFTAAALSLFTDRLANADDKLPGSDGDRRGWWGDAYLPPLANGAPDRIGSRLWLISRAQQTPETAQRAQAYCEEALQWLVDDGVAASVRVKLPSFPRLGMMLISIVIGEADPATGIVTEHQYDVLWDMTRQAVSMSGVAAGGV
jgi:phage gp46-like protein